MAFNKTIVNGATTIDVVIGQDYIINGFIYVNDDPVNNDDLVRLLLKPVSYSLSDLDTYVDVTAASAKDIWIEVTTRFTAKATEPINIGLYQEYTNEGTNTTGNLDSVSFRGPLNLLTEKKTIIYDSKCLYKNFQVQFIDSLGGYEYWTFRTYGDRGIQFTEIKQIKRNIFANWDTDWINAVAQNDYTSVNSQDTLTLRAENLSEIQVQELFELFGSVRAYDINNDKPRVLLIDKQSVSITQGEKLYNLTFNVKSTFDNYRQRQ